MKTILAACGCSRGRVRSNNEDNFYFDGEILPLENEGLTGILTLERRFGREACFAVLDGMGGEQNGEYAAWAAAERMKALCAAGGDRALPPRARLERLSRELNAAVFEKEKEMLTRHMGTTLAGLFFNGDGAFAFNLGDSRSYQLRGGELRQLSKDHVDSRVRAGSQHAKPGLTQYLGIDEEEFVVEPTITACRVEPADRFLICSDGLSDMLTEEQIAELLTIAPDPETAVRTLIDRALEQGGRDNVTVIVCCVQ